MGAHSSVQIPLEVARQVYRELIGDDTDISDRMLESFYDEVLDDRLLNCVFGEWDNSPYSVSMSESELRGHVETFKVQYPERVPTTLIYQNKTFRRMLSIMRPYPGIDWINDPFDELIKKLSLKGFVDLKD